MKFWLHRLRHWWNRPRGQSQTIELKPLATGRPSGPGHWIPVALKRAMEQGQWERASNLVDETDHLVRTWPLVAEQVARFHLALGRPDVALKTIDEAIFRTSELRLLQNVCRALEGHTVEAMADLDRWSDHPSFPVVASTLLALLKIEHDEIDDAWSLLDANLKNHEDPMSLACLFVLCKERGMTECASKLARRLQSTFGPGRS
ncbi:MAG: hypothetical protein O7G85_00320, partial [Planctomycetota bacterium]|nr:hypothetical protein [Planctomycetota bacterium]